ncbi:MAG: haloalkane dehalogenase, partial [Bacteroidota bacterium]
QFTLNLSLKGFQFSYFQFSRMCVLNTNLFTIMKVNYFSLLALILLLFAIGCEEDGDVIPQDPADQTAEESIDTLITPDGVKFVRTPEERFENLPDWPYSYQYVEIDGLRQAYVEAGPEDGEVVLLLHGQPSWSYLYRDMIPVLADSGYRVIAMDHLGFGRSDKPVDIADYSYLGHYDRITRFIEALNLSNINLFGQDWGAVIGLRVVGLNPDWFKTVTIGNGFFPNVPDGQLVYPIVENPNEIEDIPSLFTRYTPQQVPYFDNCTRLIEEFDFAEWMVYTMKARDFTASEVLEGWTWFDLPTEVEDAYNAPFPSREYMAGARVFPSLLNEVPGQTQEAWFGLANFQKPFLTIWGANDPLDLGDCELQQILIDNIPGAAGQPHHRFPDASHYLQSDKGEEIAQRLLEFYAPEPEKVRSSFEIFEIVSLNEIVTWVNIEDMTEEEFDSLELPSGWSKNTPRDGASDVARFTRSPNAEADGEFRDEMLFGHMWRHNATVVQTGVELPEAEGLLTGTLVAKFHEVTFYAGRTLAILTSPEGKEHIIVAQDPILKNDPPTIPSSWTLSEKVLTEDLTILLPNPTLNIRTDNLDTYQGPIDF